MHWAIPYFLGVVTGIGLAALFVWVLGDDDLANRVLDDEGRQ